MKGIREYDNKGLVMAKKIVYDATPFLYPGGVGRATLSLYESLCRQHPDYEFELYMRSFRQYDVPWQRILHPVRGFRLPRLAESLMKSAKVIERVTDGDLYHATDHYLPIRDLNKCVVTLHDLLFLIDPETNWESHDYYARMVPSFAVNCKSVITCSEHTKKDLVNYLQIDPANVKVIPWGIDKELFRPTKDKDAVREKMGQKFSFKNPYFLAVGCSTGRKNSQRLLEAYANLAKRGPTNDLVLTWDPPKEIRETYSKGSLKNKIHFIGRVDDESLRDLYCGSTAAVYPSLYEGFGFPILEAMSCGTAVITSNTSSMPEVGGDAVRYVEPKSTSSLEKALEEFENEPDTVKDLAERGHERSKQFSWDRCAKETLEVYRSCLDD